MIPSAITSMAAFPHKRILVLEDDLCLKELLTRLFQTISPGVETSWLTTADGALEEVSRKFDDRTSPYNLIVADIGTPGKQSGLDLWETCRLRFPEIPFLFMSSMPVDQFLRILGREKMCPAYLPKPFSLGECRQIVEGLLNYQTAAS